MKCARENVFRNVKDFEDKSHSSVPTCSNSKYTMHPDARWDPSMTWNWIQSATWHPPLALDAEPSQSSQDWDQSRRKWRNYPPKRDALEDQRRAEDFPRGQDVQLYKKPRRNDQQWYAPDDSRPWSHQGWQVNLRAASSHSSWWNEYATPAIQLTARSETSNLSLQSRESRGRRSSYEDHRDDDRIGRARHS